MQDERDSLYMAFNSSRFCVGALRQWLTGTPCNSSEVPEALNSTGMWTEPTTPPLNDVTKWSTIRQTTTTADQLIFSQIFCPMPFENSSFTVCCHSSLGQPRCCQNIQTVPLPLTRDKVRWIVALGIVFACVFVCLVVLVSFNRVVRFLCYRRNIETEPQHMMTVIKHRHFVTPVDKRILFKTGNYTVEQSWDVITIRFHSRHFCTRFKDALLTHYPALCSWKDPRTSHEGQITDHQGLDVSLILSEESRSIVVTDEGATSWVMKDFQTLCKNLNEPGYELSAILSGGGPLSPRQPTIGEEFFNAGDYTARICQTEIEIKFTSESLFDSFKRLLLGQYPTAPWTKYLQRDCAQIRLDSGKFVTVHMWEDVRSIWLSGDGKKDWYVREFPLLHMAAVADADPCNAFYTVKTLYLGGYEVEFPKAELIPKVRELLEKRYPGLSWRTSNSREETLIPVAKKTETKKRNKNNAQVYVSIQLGNWSMGERRMWLNGELTTLKQWLTDELGEIYVAADTSVNDTNATTAPN